MFNYGFIFISSFPVREQLGFLPNHSGAIKPKTSNCRCQCFYVFHGVLFFDFMCETETAWYLSPWHQQQHATSSFRILLHLHSLSILDDFPGDEFFLLFTFSQLECFFFTNFVLFYTGNKLWRANKKDENFQLDNFPVKSSRVKRCRRGRSACRPQFCN